MLRIEKGESVCLINEIAGKISRGLLQSELTVGKRVEIDNFKTSTVKDIISNRAGNWIITKNSKYRFFSNLYPSEAIVGIDTGIMIKKVYPDYEDTSTGKLDNSISGHLSKKLCLSKPLIMHTLEGTRLTTSNVVEVYYIRKQLRLLRTISSVYTIDFI